jgi:hypothetical protein
MAARPSSHLPTSPLPPPLPARVQGPSLPHAHCVVPDPKPSNATGAKGGADDEGQADAADGEDAPAVAAAAAPEATLKDPAKSFKKVCERGHVYVCVSVCASGFTRVADAHARGGTVPWQKGKVAAKASGQVRQWNIMESMGVPADEIPRFADSLYWLTYFPPLAMVRASRGGRGGMRIC